MDSKSNDTNHLEHFSKAVNIFRDRAKQILVFILFRIIRRLVLTLQKFTWAVTGVERVRRDAARGLNFKQSAHVQEIFWKQKFLDHSVAGVSNFITTHRGFRPPSCVLRPNVSLYCMTGKEAVFVEVAEADNLYKTSRQSMYLYQTQFRHAVNIITLPLASFHKIASDVGNPRLPVTWLSCTTRSGASLLTQMLSRIPGMLVLTEPDVLTTLGQLYKTKQIAPGEYNQLLASSVRLLCKPDDRFSAVFIKGRPSTTALVEDVVQVFPRFRYLFMYRNSIKSVLSSVNLFHQDPAPKVLRLVLDSNVLSVILPFVRKHFYNHHVFLNDKAVPGLNHKKFNTVCLFTSAWAASVSRCMDLRFKGFPVCSILYEDFMKKPRRSLSILMELLDIRKEYLGLACEALKFDYNRVSSCEMTIDSRRALSHEARLEADIVMKAWGLPKLGERHEVAGLLKLD